MELNAKEVDAIIFDMDGTLWNAMDSYAEVWNVAFAERGIDLRIDSEVLKRGIGKTISEIYQMLVEEYGLPIGTDEFLARVDEIEEELLPELGGVPYPGMVEGLAALSKQYKLFLVSNCGAQGLDNFMRFTGIEEYITDSLSYGMQRLPKSENMLLLKQRYGLKNPVYVGDTQGDCNQTRRAGLPFVYAAYGFGDCDDYDFKAETFQDVVDFFQK